MRTLVEQGREGRPVLVACHALLGMTAMGLSIRYAVVPWLRRAPVDAAYPYTNMVLTDFRDTAYLPVRSLAAGIDPYDIAAHHAMFPHAQEFDAYAPWWLTLCWGLRNLAWGPASFIGAVVLVLCTVALAAWSGRELGSLVGFPEAGRRLAIPAMVALVWLWRPTAIGQGLGNPGAVVALAAAGVLLAGSRVTAGSILLALTWLKPQFAVGLVVVLVARGRWRTIVGGTLLALAASLPAIVRLSAVSGGFLAWCADVRRGLLEVASRTDAEPLQGRVDLVGMLCRAGWAVPVAGLALAAVVLVALGIVLDCRARRIGRPFIGHLAMGVFLLLATPHIHYDLTMLAPLLVGAVGELWMAAGRRRGERLTWAAVVLLAAGGLVPGGLLPRLTVYNQFLGTCLVLSAVLIAAELARQCSPRSPQV